MTSTAINTPYRYDLLKGKRALVTGASKGIGRTCSLYLSACGAEVVAVARSEPDLRSLANEAPEKLTPVTMDATSEEFLDYIDDSGPFDILVNNLGTNVPQFFVEVTPTELDRMLTINIRTVFTITQHVVRQMLRNNTKGSIINISSQMGHVGSPKRSVYCATKHAVEGFTKALGVELAEKGIRVNSVCPTFIETPLTASMLDDPDFRKMVHESIPMNKLGTTQDVANAVVFLASEASSLCTGSSIKVDGGWTAR